MYDAGSGFFDSVDHEAILVEGMAGSGKSTLIAGQAGIYSRYGRCLLLSFSRAGEEVLRKYTQEAAASGKALLDVYTVDGLATELLRRLNDVRTIRSRDQVLQDLPALLSEASERLQGADFESPSVNAGQMQQLLTDLEYFRNALAFETEDAEECQEICRGNVNADVRLLRVLFALYESYRDRWLPNDDREDHYSGLPAGKRLPESGFRMLGDAIVDLLSYPPEAWFERLEPYDYIFIDEFHDITPLQLRFIQQLAVRGTRVMAVGDRNQNIYGWRAANTELVFDEFISHFDALQIDQGSTHRFGQGLADLCGQVNGRQYQAVGGQTLIEEGLLQDYFGTEARSRRSTVVIARNYAELYQAVFRIWELTEGRLVMSFGLVSNFVVSLINTLYAIKYREFVPYKMEYDARRFLESPCCQLTPAARQEILRDLNGEQFLAYMDGYLRTTGQAEAGFGPAFRKALGECLQQDVSLSETLTRLQRSGAIFESGVAHFTQQYDVAVLRVIVDYLVRHGAGWAEWPGIYNRLIGAWQKNRGLKCITVAPAKGHEFDTVMVYAGDRNGFLNQREAGMRQRNEFYVAISRSKKKLILLGDKPL